MDIRKINLQRLNSLTKYPSIPTFHALDPKNGNLIEEAVNFTGDDSGLVLATEKIDGTNARIICLPDGSYMLGSREELLYAKGDLIGNPALGIVDALKSFAEGLPQLRYTIGVLYVEVYGGKVTAASKQYTSSQAVSFRLFDVAVIEDWAERLETEASAIAAWRDAGGQQFMTESALVSTADKIGATLAPRVASLPIGALPTSIEGMHAYLKSMLPVTLSALDEGAGQRPEGLVFRSTNRSTIAKARFEDYERTAKRRKT